MSLGSTHEKQLSDVLSQFARTMATNFPIQGILDHLVQRIVEMLPVGSVGVTLISPGLTPRFVAASDDRALRYERLQTELGEGPCLLAFHSGQAVQVPDLRFEQRFPKFGPRALTEGMRAVFTFPLRHEDCPLGALDLYRDTPGGLSVRALAVAQTLADVTAAYLINAQARQDLEDSSKRSRQLALHDALTGLPNRALMLERLERSFLRSRRTHKTSAVLFVDLDGFKNVNDTWGHGVGDQLLVAVANRLSSTLRPPDTIARLHGDEFVILCEDLDGHDQADAIVSRLVGAMAQPFVVPSTRVNISASVGIAFADSDVHDPEQVLRQADLAMYQAKRRGHGGRQFFDPSYEEAVENQDSLELDLHQAVPQKQLQALYQPIVVTESGQISGFEALLRWNHPKRGLVPPLSFIPLAERTSLISDIGLWVLRRASADRTRLQDLRPDHQLGVAVNVSADQLMAPGFADAVLDILQTEQTSPSELTLEITESVFVRDNTRALTVLNELKQIGVLIALDDFGTGYSSLSHLNHFPVDVVKVDRSFVANLGHDSASEIIVTAVVHLAHALGLSVIAEGVETSEQRESVVALGCDASQGYYFARPMTVIDAMSIWTGPTQLPVHAAPPSPAVPA